MGVLQRFCFREVSTHDIKMKKKGETCSFNTFVHCVLAVSTQLDMYSRLQGKLSSNQAILPI